MKIVIARYGRFKKRYFNNTYYLDDKRLIELGEPFLLHPDPRIDRIPLVRLLGPNYFWRVKGSNPVVIGEGLDDWVDAVSMKEMLFQRREGNIWGRWFSTACPKGELGSFHLFDVEPVSGKFYEELIDKIRFFRGA